MDSHFIFEFLGVIFAVIAAIWVYEQYVQKRFDVMWKRMDERQSLYFKSFVEQKLYDNDLKHAKERNDEKFSNLNDSFSQKFVILSEKLDDLKEALKEALKDKESH